jgi:hypothetical protein
VIDAPWLGAALLWGGIGGALVLTIAGGAILVRAGLRLNDRLSTIRGSALLQQTEEVLAKFAGVEARVEDFPRLIARAQRALVALRDSRLQVRAIGETLNFAAQIARALLLGPEKKRDS